MAVPAPPRRARARASCGGSSRRSGADTLAPFALRSDKSYFFAADESAFLAYRVVGGVAIVSGDPIGAADARVRRSSVASSTSRTSAAGASPCSACRSEDLELYRALGLRALYHGDEAVVETASFSLEGRAIRKVRQSVTRLQKAGFSVDACCGRARSMRRCVRSSRRSRAPGAATRRSAASSWRSTRSSGSATRTRSSSIGFDRDGRAAGFLHFGVSPRRLRALALVDAAPSDVPNGFTEWLICESIAWARGARLRARVAELLAVRGAALARCAS